MIYFAQSPAGGPIKIGFSRNPQGRMRSFAQGLQIIASMPGDVSDERFIHKKLAFDRIEGEWFQDTPAVRDEIAVAQRSDTVNREDEDSQFYRRTFVLMLEFVFGSGIEAHRAAAKAASVPVATAKQWFQERSTPSGQNLSKLFSARAECRAWNDQLTASAFLAEQDGISLREAFKRVGTNLDVVKTWRTAPLIDCPRCGCVSRPRLEIQ